MFISRSPTPALGDTERGINRFKCSSDTGRIKQSKYIFPFKIGTLPPPSLPPEIPNPSPPPSPPSLSLLPSVSQLEKSFDEVLWTRWKVWRFWKQSFFVWEGGSEGGKQRERGREQRERGQANLQCFCVCVKEGDS